MTVIFLDFSNNLYRHNHPFKLYVPGDQIKRGFAFYVHAVYLIDSFL